MPGPIEKSPTSRDGDHDDVSCAGARVRRPTHRVVGLPAALGGELDCAQVRSLDPPRGLLSAVYNASPEVRVDLPPGWRARIPGNGR